MTEGFNINDRTTWAWAEVKPRVGDTYLLDPESPDYFIHVTTSGTPLRMPCPSGLVFDPTVEPGPVCDWPFNIDHAKVYEWAVAHGQVTDQR